ncbi:MIP/aquaporin family protein [Streptomyces olivaceus]|uniref:Aquaporin family protein n=1 Tax=Streptomyces olivaceus TaxID=47716 RepID=A0ABS7W4U5_STROV|nr:MULTISPECIES: MIP/aquaporin family protein [Streptomyces]AOW86168.1 glycerol transporter [Streptomyces olivaceus]MBZ6090099.1 aquaporin family protein [Streptomyces olivaceus]MBZ6096275.1 aquaporin family protein [Streptomyces olivaceus]MBZ6117329.1 aquaporin family protein [Streptomyces olivaceus]MBZ6152599.1 aquaporin family protein [Streptomyces olivaceus]
MSSSDIFIGETIGTAILILLGGGVCAAVTLKASKARNAGWVAIALGWGFAVMTAAYISGPLSGAHLNPAVTVGIAIKDGDWSNTPTYFAGQILGAMIGAVLVWIAYYGQFQAHLTDREIVGGPGAQDTTAKSVEAQEKGAGPVLGVFSTGPEIRHTVQNLATEIIGTFVLLLAILTQGLNDEGNGLGILGALITGFVVVSIGLSLGGPTGYAINPVRDLGPRIVHALLPLPNKGGSDWSYAWIPVVGPLVGGAIAGGVYNVAFA